MYTEIKEVVNFVARYLFHRIPRRKVCLFSENLANALLQRFACQADWDIANPKQGEPNRVIYLSRSQQRCDQAIYVSAITVGVETDEVLSLMPETMLIFVNPGSVRFHLGENTQPCPIWNGPIDSDDRYCAYPSFLTQPSTNEPRSNMGAAAKPHYMGKLDSDREVNQHDYVALEIEEPSVITDESADLRSTRYQKVFVFVSKDQSSYTVEQFALTRFGSHRQRPDHEVMRRIQKQAAFRQLIGHPPQPPAHSSHNPYTSNGMVPPSAGAGIRDIGDTNLYSNNMNQSMSRGGGAPSPLNPTIAAQVLDRFRELSTTSNRPPADLLSEVLSFCLNTGVNLGNDNSGMNPIIDVHSMMSSMPRGFGGY